MEEKLGKGLDALIRDIDEQENPNTGITTLPITRIMPNRYQPRKLFDDGKLRELADSIRENGIIQPIIVTKTDDSEYELVAGERRLEGAKLAGLTEVPVIIRSVSQKEQLQLAIIENIQRENLNPIEEAGAFQRLIDEFQMNHEQISEIMGKDRSTITNSLRLLRLSQPIQDMVLQGTLTSGHARAILAIDEEKQLDFARFIITNALSVRQSEEKVREYNPEKPEKKPKAEKAPAVPKDPYIVSIEEQLTEVLGFKTTIQDKDYKGKIVIEYKDQTEFDDLIRKLNLE
jgi:ParB family transcriptional regulator, chromosome partitioning protein